MYPSEQETKRYLNEIIAHHLDTLIVKRFNEMFDAKYEHAIRDEVKKQIRQLLITAKEVL